ncbi:MAG: anhydro-N-acetylmuramic acid kinase [Phenylobacterium sp.]|jgi:anhydro-N-acetylmuramic acid kinase|uniref:anhydro-N-acetylmuramic acid kinase n=1 Tax=Phenylobacterium sp. TaxID=1871053 RepID=UPI0025F2A1EA|nr:anhydro-N-acetylmuramic acid kinase [Phenylobacterium sp.]MCA3732455.1 anhydro-N-acetylmuramic acid kinase [Phenylobacterium sp.]
MRILGFMTGTSLDAVDMAILETDGEVLTDFGPAGEEPLSDPLRALLRDAIRTALDHPRDAPDPPVFAAASRAVAEVHLSAGTAFLASCGLDWSDLDLVGMHGQTVLHERPSAGRKGRTLQLGDGAWLARATGVPVVFDFRTVDVAAGGEGAPLAPVYHLARAAASGLTAPLAVLNIGGVANLTCWAGGDQITAFDTGPGNGLIDQVVTARGAGRFDVDGRLAAAGVISEPVLSRLMDHSWFSEPAPKSLDRYDFSPAPTDALSLEDAVATLTAFTAEAVASGFRLVGVEPSGLIVTGGGRRNPVLMAALADRLGCEVVTAESVGWRGDALEAEAFAFLAARCLRGLPISFPGTTGVRAPMTGGRLAQPG